MKTNNKTNAATEAALSPSAKVLERYIIKDGPAKGLIDHADADFALRDMIAAMYTAVSVKSIKDIFVFNLDFDDIYRQCVKDFRDKIWTGKYCCPNPGKPGRLEPCTTSPKNGINYRNTLRADIQNRLIESFRPRTPTLAHAPDPERFLTLLSRLFPNVVSPLDAANAMRTVIENIHNSCGTPGASFRQKALWLVSYKNGGTGKSHFLNGFNNACSLLGLDAEYHTFRDPMFVEPSAGLHTVIISEDTPKLSSDMAEILNTIIDRSIFAYNIKFGAKGHTQSFANVLIASNYAPFENNSRRYAIVEYLQSNLEFLPEETLMRYFPHWKDDEGIRDDIVGLFESCPFASEHASFDLDDPTDFGSDVKKAPKLIPIAPKHEDVLVQVHQFLDIVPNVEPCTPHQFTKRLFNALDLPPYEMKDFQSHLVNMLETLRSENKLKEGGSTRLSVRNIDWQQLKRFSVGPVEESDEDPLETIRRKWQALIKANDKQEAR